MFTQKTFSTTALIWIPLALLFSIGLACTYVAVQQNYRTSLNDPQVQVTQDAVVLVANGQTPESLVPTEKINMAISLSPFIIVYDEQGKTVAGSGLLNGAVPTPPHGVFDYAKEHGVNKLTWQPQTGVRIAAVIKPFSGPTKGYVLSGRSMREVESRIDSLGNTALLAWLVGLATSLVATLALAAIREKN